MSREDKLFISDIRQACDNVIKFSTGLSKDAFFKDQKSCHAVLHNLSIIGEAVKRLSNSLKKKHSVVDWRKIAGLRDIIVHEYFGLDVHILWDIISYEAPKLRDQLKNVDA